MGCVANALSYIHSQNIKHKDIKPDNILIDGARVYITDFDLSIKFKHELTSASKGERKYNVTWKYASPEAILTNNRELRGRAQDIYSLACVFIEIFAVYKKSSAKTVLDEFEPGTHIYSKNMPKVLKWMEDRVSQRSDVQLLRLIRAMVKENPKERPLAKQVWEELVIVRGESPEAHFCGACCMPMDSLEKEIPDCAPHPLEYRLPRGDSKVTKSATDSSDFETQYDQENHSPYYWQRYLRVDHSFTLDSVLNKAHGNAPGNQYLCRKTFAIRQAAQITDQASSDLRRPAQIEAKILKTHKHRHIVAFSATYQDGDRLALLTVPVTPYDLREYLSMVELQQAKEIDNDWGHWRTILRTAPGCLAGAVSFLHKQGIVHGDISPENIIVDFSQPTSKVCLANFGRAAIIKYVKDLYMLSYGGPESKHPNQYASSNSMIFEAMDNSNDVFSLGCAFLEMETVRKGEKREVMWQELIKDTSNTVVNADEADSRSLRGDTESTNHKLDATPTPIPQTARKKDAARDGNDADLEKGQDMNTEDDTSTYSQLSGDVRYKEPEVFVNLRTWVVRLYKDTTGGDNHGKLIERMVHQEPKKRPTASEVFFLTGTKIKDHTRSFMCGDNCIPEAEEQPDPQLAKSST